MKPRVAKKIGDIGPKVGLGRVSGGVAGPRGEGWAAAGRPKGIFFLLHGARPWTRIAAARPKGADAGQESEPKKGSGRIQNIPAIAGCVHRGRKSDFG